MRTKNEHPYIKEESFKESKNSKKKGRQKEEHNSSSDISEDDEVANFVKILNKGTDSRYSGKIPLFFFNCDGIGHFDNKCPYKKKRNDEGYSKGKQTYKGKRTTKKVFKKILCTKEYISSSDEYEVSDSETDEVLFMEVEDSNKEDSEEEYEKDEEEYEEVKEEIEEAEVDYREVLMCSIEVIIREKKKKKKLQEELDKKEDTQELEQMITNLKVQIEKYKRIEEALKEQLEENDKIIGNLEAEIVTLRKDLQKRNMQNNSKVFDDIIISKKSHHDKSELGYNQTKKG
jgi:DNA repair exonuclease SbcCD ATPase subunit